MSYEQYVDAAEAAKFLGVSREFVLQLARAGKIPAHPLPSRKRRTWRFLLSELSTAMDQTYTPV
jgi:excisionase family DNA binding protein